MVVKEVLNEGYIKNAVEKYGSSPKRAPESRKQLINTTFRSVLI